MTETETQIERCKIEKCKRPLKAKGYCNVHFRKWRRGELPKKPRYKTCGEENCRKPLFQFGMCEVHFNSWRSARKGESKVEKPQAEKQETEKKESESPPEKSVPEDA